MFEPIWNSNYVDHVQITMAEDIGIGGRAGYYDGIGAARDVIQNHLLQLMALTAMEEPISFDSRSLRMEKLKVSGVRRPAAPPGPDHRPRPVRRGLVRRRQGPRLPPGAGHRRLLDHRDVRRDPAAASTTAAGRGCRSTCAPASGSAGGSPRSRSVQAGTAPAVPGRPRPRTLTHNALVVRVQPDEGVTLRFGAKVPGTAMEIRDVNMDFAYGGSVHRGLPGGVRAADPRRAAG